MCGRRVFLLSFSSIDFGPCSIFSSQKNICPPPAGDPSSCSEVVCLSVRTVPNSVNESKKHMLPMHWTLCHYGTCKVSKKERFSPLLLRQKIEYLCRSLARSMAWSRGGERSLKRGWRRRRRENPFSLPLFSSLPPPPTANLSSNLLLALQG